VVVDDVVVGWVDYDHDRPWLESDEVNVGYNVFRPFRGNGYATRAVRLLMRHLALDTEWQVATLLIHPDNERSLALARRAGFEPVGELDGNPYWRQRVSVFVDETPSPSSDLFTVRAAHGPEVVFIEEMIVEAANWDSTTERRSRQDTLADRGIHHYVEGWPQPGDISVVAQASGGALIGAAWCRQFSADDSGYGFIDATIPEVSIGVVAEWRGRGVGGALLDSLARAARDREVDALSLSVERTNPALRLYERHGYVVVDDTGGALTMRLDLTP
jgi:RimJ/RimL family protein N-acetyltransferase